MKKLYNLYCIIFYRIIKRRQKTELPTKTSQLTNDSKYVTETDVEEILGDIESVLSNL